MTESNYRAKVYRKPRLRFAIVESLPLIDEQELKALLATYFHSPPRLLAELDKTDLAGMGRERTTSVRTKPIPTTGKPLSELIGWSDLTVILGSMSAPHVWALSCWVGYQPPMDAEERAKLPEVTVDLQVQALRALIKHIKRYL